MLRRELCTGGRQSHLQTCPPRQASSPRRNPPWPAQLHFSAQRAIPVSPPPTIPEQGHMQPRRMAASRACAAACRCPELLGLHEGARLAAEQSRERVCTRYRWRLSLAWGSAPAARLRAASWVRAMHTPHLRPPTRMLLSVLLLHDQGDCHCWAELRLMMVLSGQEVGMCRQFRTRNGYPEMLGAACIGQGIRDWTCKD